MAYAVIENFKAGLDARRQPWAAPPGSLIRGRNAIINRGGEIEKAKAFVSKGAFSANTFGLFGTDTTLYAFGSEASGSVSVPAGVTYQRLQHPTVGRTMVKLRSCDAFNGKVYAIAEYDDGSVHQFYDGTRIAAWDSGTVGSAVAGLVGTFALTFGNKIYVCAGSVVAYCKTGDPTNWVTADGAGTINISTHAGGSVTLTALAPYQGNMLIFARTTTQIWFIDVDPSLNRKLQTLSNIGTRAPATAISFGDTDVFFLADSGIRSARPRDSTNSAAVYDIGTPIDPAILSAVAALSSATVSSARAVLTPTDGQYWLMLGTTLYCFSYYPGSKISAWTTFEPGFSITGVTVYSGRVYVRSTDALYLYGGDNDNTYDASEMDVILPYLSAQTIATLKRITGFDFGVTGGNVALSMGFDPNNEVWVPVGILDRPSFNMERLGAIAAEVAIVAPRFQSTAAAKVVIANMVVHYESSRA